MPEMAAAGLWTTATDLARFSLDLQLALAGQPHRLLAPEMVRLFLAPHVQHDANGFMGLGVWLDGRGPSSRFGHPGDNEGFAARWTAVREGGMGAVILTNSDMGGALIDDVLDAIAEAYGWPEVEDLPAPAPGRHASMIKYVGTYEFGSGIVCTITLLQDQLYLQMLSQPPVLLTAISESVYLLHPLDGEVIFLMSGEGMVRGLRLRQDGSELEAGKVG